MKRLIKVLLITLSLILVLTSCQTKQEGTTIKVGVVGTNEEKIWEFVKEKLEKEGIHIEITVFTDYNKPNDALLYGDIDINAFQHYDFLESYLAQKNEKIEVLAETYLSPLGIYSNKIKDVKEVKNGDTIAIPNDPTNNSRSLLLLQEAGLIKVNAEKGNKVTLQDVTENPLNLDIKEVDASQTARALDDVTISIINGGMAVDAGLVPEKDSIHLESLSKDSKPFINIIAIKPENKDKEVFKKVVEAFQADDTADVVKDVTKGACIPVWNMK